jgi:hypothetical protein
VLKVSTVLAPMGEKEGILMDQKKSSKLSNVNKKESFKYYFHILFRQDPIMFGQFTARFLNDNMFF